VAEHSFHASFCWCDSARAQGLQKTNMPSIGRSFYLFNTRSICAIFLYNWTQCIDDLSLLSQRYVRQGNDAKNPAILSFFFVTERTQLRTVPTFVSAHTFCASRKAWFKCHARAGLTLTQSTTPPSTRLKWKQNFPTVTKSSLMNRYLNQEHQNSSISLTTDC